MSGYRPWAGRAKMVPPIMPIPPEMDPKQIRWDKHFLTLCEEVATMSRDKRTKVGCVVVRSDGSIAVTGFNGFPRGIDDSKEERYEDPAKYFFTSHAEENAFLTAARHGVKLERCTVYTLEPPCARCARAIIQLKIAGVIFPRNNTFETDPEKIERHKEDQAASRELLREAEVNVRRI